MKEICHCFWIDASLDDVYAALTEKAGLAGWWTKNVDCSGELGSVSTFRFTSGAFNKMKITLLEPSKIEWKCLDGNEEWIGTNVTFELRREAERIKICFFHSGWRELTEYLGECSFHWAHYLVSLKSYCETGKGMPNEG